MQIFRDCRLVGGGALVRWEKDWGINTMLGKLTSKRYFRFFLAVILLVTFAWARPKQCFGQAATAEVGLFNGSFDVDADGDGIPDGWSTAGRAGVVQRLRQVEDPERGKVARLECTQFEPGFPDSHAMIAQVGRVTLRQGQWYQVRLWARAEKLEAGGVQIAVANRRTWQETGFQEFFSPSRQWESFEFYIQSRVNLPADDSRLQIWFTGTGVLYLDALEIEPVASFRPERLPQIPWINPANALPNSSFECGGAAWGTYAPRLSGWGSHLFFPVGEPDRTKAYHGRTSWRITVNLEEPLISYFDYFDPRAEVVDCLVVANEGWIPVEPGQQYLLRAAVAGDRPGGAVILFVRQADGRSIEKGFPVETAWKELQLLFRPDRPLVYVGVGPDLRGKPVSHLTLWIDALQLVKLEHGANTLPPYEPRAAVEAFLSCSAKGNIFTDPDSGLSFTLQAFNSGKESARLRGRVWITDFWDRTVWEEAIDRMLPPGDPQEVVFQRVLPGRRGFFRIWFAREDPRAEPVSLRVAVIDPFPEDQESAYGMNHAFGWSEVIRLAHLAGITWWRDWSSQWRLVQKSPDAAFDFSIPQTQIDRVVKLGGQVVMLLPFPAAPWAVEVDPKKIAAEAGGNRYLADRLLVAQKPRDMVAFGRYVESAVAHFYPRVKRIEILNEPLFTSYALPAGWGHTLADYLDLLRTAYQQAKKVSSDICVVGGIAAPPEHRFVREFAAAGGARWCDVVNLHLYPHRGDPLTYEKAFRDHWDLLRSKGPQRPIWVTEFGLYADDDPAVRPFRVGDATMTRSLRPSELRASADLVKFSAIMRAYGVEKIFYHAGTCGAWNEDSAGNIFFEYGPAPRKMYAAQAVLSRILPADARFVRRWEEPPGLVGFQFATAVGQKQVVVLWAVEEPLELPVPENWVALDIMGNPLEGDPVKVGEVPIYLVHSGN